ncbi:hypothetical protein KAH55_08705, partial [bacterium]|nr:hypothetical protein [bacterium]
DSDWEFFVDEDGDGVNDQIPGRKGKGRRGFIDEDGDGVYDRATKRQRKGRLFIDEDSDGVCDLFQDEDGDGIVNCKDEDWDRPAGQGKRRFGNRRNGRRNAPADDGNEPEDGTGN